MNFNDDFQKLLENRFEDILKFCSESNIKIKDLLPQNNNHSDQNRKTLLNQLVDHLKSSGPKEPLTYSSTPIHCTSPTDVIMNSLSKLKQKHDRSLQALERIKRLKIERKIWVKKKMKQFRHKEKVVEKQAKEKKSLQEEKIRKSLDKNEKIALNKSINEERELKFRRSIEEKLGREIKKTGNNKRNSPVSENAPKKAETLSLKTEDLASYFQDKNQSRSFLSSTVMANKLQPIEDHLAIVNKKHAKAKKRHILNTKAALASNIKKAIILNAKSNKKDKLNKEYSSKIRMKLDQSFQKRDEIVHKVNEKYQERIRHLNEKDLKQVKDFSCYKQSKEEYFSRKKAQNELRKCNQTQNYNNLTAMDQLHKSRILQKHQKIYHVAEMLSKFKESLSQRKKMINFNVQNQRIRSISVYN